MRSAKAKKAFSRIAYLGLKLASPLRHAGDRREVTPHTWIKKRHDMVEESRPCPYALPGSAVLVWLCLPLPTSPRLCFFCSFTAQPSTPGRAHRGAHRYGTRQRAV